MQNSLLELKKILNNFQNKYNGRLRISDTIIDVTDCFLSKETREYKAPISFGNVGRNNKVYLYVVYGAPFIEKFKRSEDGKLIYRNGKFVIKERDDDYKTLTCLCLPAIRNVSLHEIYDALKGKDEVQGFRKWALRNILLKINSLYLDFDINRDTAFIFSGQEEEVKNKIKLNKIWLKQFLCYGGHAIEIINAEEVRLMEKIFDENLLFFDNEDYYKVNSYMYGKEIHVPETSIFLQKKLELFRKTLVVITP